MIVGTAGHIDHGKTALIRALTGVETDRLSEEKVRGISIDLGFAYLPTAKGIIGFVDVPGHERFIRNMLAGISAIDFVLLVVAANEGIKPQTLEHVQIAHLLDLSRGAVALTKLDLAESAQRETVSSEIRTLLGSTSLKGIPIVPVSSLTGEGIDGLRQLLVDAHNVAARPEPGGRFRMTVDRSFTLAGTGTVVTGTVTGGQISAGEQVIVSPPGLEAQVRSIHAQNKKSKFGQAGDRCALNLGGSRINRDAISRGDVIVEPTLHSPTDRIDVFLRVLGTEKRSLSNWTPIKLHHGTAETVARVVILADGPLHPGQSGFAQFVLDRPAAAATGDRFIIRDISDQRTMGGGRFIDLRAPARRRRAPLRIALLQGQINRSSVAALHSLLSLPPHYINLTTFGRDRALSLSQLDGLVRELRLVSLPYGKDTLVLSSDRADRFKSEVLSVLASYHHNNVEAFGIGIEKLRLRLESRLPASALNALLQDLVDTKSVAIEGAWVRLASHKARLTNVDERLWNRIQPLLTNHERFRPPKVRDLSSVLACAEHDVRRLLKTLARMGQVQEVSQDHFFARDVISEVLDIVTELSKKHADRITAVDLRDRLDNGRRVSIQLLEFFDRHGITIRRGDFRILNKSRLRLFGK